MFLESELIQYEEPPEKERLPNANISNEVDQIITQIHCILAAIKEKERQDGEESITIPHSERVSELASQVALNPKIRNQLNLSPEELSICALAHDIGKLSFDSSLIHSSEKIDKEIFIAKVKTHPSFGAMFLNINLLDTPIDRKNPFSLALYDAIIFHHQKLDGSGYPTLNHKENFLISTQIISITDAFDAKLTRAYTEEKPFDEKVNELTEELLDNPNKYNPEIVEAVCETVQFNESLYADYFEKVYA